MKHNEYSFQSRVWMYPGMSGWHFVTVPKQISEDISIQFSHLKRGWGSVPVNVSLNTTVWTTSIFPESKTSCYLLPLKSQIRKKEHITEGDIITLRLEIRQK